MTAPARNLSLSSEPLSERIAHAQQLAMAYRSLDTAADPYVVITGIQEILQDAKAMAEGLERDVDYLAGVVRAGEEERIQLCDQLCDQLRELRESWDELQSLGVHVYSQATAAGATHRVSHRYERLVLETDDYHKALTLTRELYALQKALAHTNNTNHKQVSND